MKETIKQNRKSRQTDRKKDRYALYMNSLGYSFALHNEYNREVHLIFENHFGQETGHLWPVKCKINTSQYCLYLECSNGYFT